MSVHQLYPLHNLSGLTARQVRYLSLAVSHEVHRCGSRAKDERLGEDTRAREEAMRRELLEVAHKVSRLDAVANG